MSKPPTIKPWKPTVVVYSYDDIDAGNRLKKW